MSDISFEPRVTPRDAKDGLLSAIIGIVQMGVIFVLPGFACYHLTGNKAIAIGLGIALYIIFALHSVHNIVMTPDGLRLTRILGRPAFIPWSSVTSIHEVSRAELIFRGWLWPLVLPREMTPSLTSLGHFRIDFDDRSIYFPPADPRAFIAAAQDYFNRLKARRSAA